MISLLLALALQTTAVLNDTFSWDHYDSDIVRDQVVGFLVCLDGQPTSQCVNVPASSGVPIPGTSGVLAAKNYSYKLPPMLAGNHTISVQACTLANNNCSSGASLAFTFQIVISNPFNLRMVKK